MISPLPKISRSWTAVRYGGPEVLELQSAPLVHPRGKQLLIQVQATTVSAGDRRIRALDFPRGMGLLARALFGVRRPRRPILGSELIGIVVAVGEQMTLFAEGDEIIAFPGAKGGGHAEYVLLDECSVIVRRPAGIKLAEAAALGFGGTTARDFLRRSRLQAGERIMVIGASGTVGSAMVQLAAHAGARVTAVTSSGNGDLVRGLGATDVIDYTAGDLADDVTYDIIADTVGAVTFSKACALLKIGGRFLAINGGIRDMLAGTRDGRRCIAGAAQVKSEDLRELASLCKQGLFTPLIDRILPFEALPTGHARADTGRKRGAIVIEVS
jgi:NADPH:quinone reductase-like Zn-dependent oxidoreductase